MEQITSSINLFVDSSQGHNAESKGDDYNVNLQDANIKCGDGEHFRMTLNNFSMAKNFHDVNENNNEFRFKTNLFDQRLLFLKKGNYASVHDLAVEFADKVRHNIVLHTGGDVLPHTNVLPDANVNSNTGVISFTINTSVDHGLTSAFIQFNSDVSESYALLGGDRVQNGRIACGCVSESPSIDVDFTGAKTIKVACRYPAQRSTMPYVYLRAPGTLNNNIETRGLRHPSDTHTSDTAHSDILGRAVVASNEWVQYTARTEKDFFIDIHQKHLNVLRLRLTDSKNRSIGHNPYRSSAELGIEFTEPGLNPNHSTLGNLSFSAVIRIDTIKTKKIEHLDTLHHSPSVPARFSNGIVNQLSSNR